MTDLEAIRALSADHRTSTFVCGSDCHARHAETADALDALLAEIERLRGFIDVHVDAEISRAEYDRRIGSGEKSPTNCGEPHCEDWQHMVPHGYSSPCPNRH